MGVQSIRGGTWMNTMLTLDHWGSGPRRDGMGLRVSGDALLDSAVAAGEEAFNPVR